jgi:hypothetical protein
LFGIITKVGWMAPSQSWPEHLAQEQEQSPGLFGSTAPTRVI